MDPLCNLFAHREAQAWAPTKKSLPVTLVTGFLGSGKTTLLTHVLHNKHNLKIAAAVNDFAEVNIDGQIVRGTKGHGEVVELSNGCLCCSVSGEFKSAVWKLLQDADIGKIDYLMVETSGVTDPQRTIATLEQKYGKMYRVRLDAVVTVVDTDVLVTKLAGGGGREGLGSVAADSQLRCADVVLLNKSDLVSKESLHEAKEFVKGLVPGVQVYTCTNCAVPLHCIMEVSEVCLGSEVVSHEVTDSAYTISEVGGVMNAPRRSRQSSNKKEGNSGGDEKDHLSADEFVSVVFESKEPLHLSEFQSFLGINFPAGLLRMKGTVWFKENLTCLYSFHMSGRHRYEISPLARRGDSLTGAFSVQLVAIGKGMDVEHVRGLLNSCLVETEKLEQDVMSDFAEIVADDDRFQVVNSSASSGTPAETCVDFRLTGCVEYGVSEEDASRFHGINFNRMNAELVKRVNGGSHRISLIPVLLSSGLLVCRHSACSKAGFEKSWPIIQEIAGSIPEEFYRAVGFCECGR